MTFTPPCSPSGQAEAGRSGRRWRLRSDCSAAPQTALRDISCASAGTAFKAAATANWQGSSWQQQCTRDLVKAAHCWPGPTFTMSGDRCEQIRQLRRRLEHQQQQQQQQQQHKIRALPGAAEERPSDDSDQTTLELLADIRLHSLHQELDKAQQRKEGLMEQHVLAPTQRGVSIYTRASLLRESPSARVRTLAICA